MSHKFGPCLDKKCSWCCDPVKVPANFPDAEIPTDKDSNKIWRDRNEIIAPDGSIESTRLKTFDCNLLDQESGQCSDYDNRPEICRGTSCVNENSQESVDEQHRQTTEQEFTTLIKGKRN